MGGLRPLSSAWFLGPGSHSGGQVHAPLPSPEPVPPELSSLSARLQTLHLQCIDQTTRQEDSWEGGSPKSLVEWPRTHRGVSTAAEMKGLSILLKRLVVFLAFPHLTFFQVSFSDLTSEKARLGAVGEGQKETKHACKK